MGSAYNRSGGCHVLACRRMVARASGPDDSKGPWQFQLLGAFEVSNGQSSLSKLRSRTANELLAYMALHPGKELSRVDLGGIFWPDSDCDRQQQNVRRCLSDIRLALEGDDEPGTVFIKRRDHSGLNAACISTDVGDFRKLIRETVGEKVVAHKCAALQGAVELYAGPLLPTMAAYCFVPIRMELEEQFARAVVTLCEHYCESNPSLATTLGRQAVQRAPLREDLHVALIRAFVKSGMPAEAVRQFEELERVLDENFGEAPSLAAVAALESIPRTDRTAPDPPGDRQIVLLSASPDLPFGRELAAALSAQGSDLVEAGNTGKWARRLEEKVRDSAAVVALIRPQDVDSEALFGQCELGLRLAQVSGGPRLIAFALDGVVLDDTPLANLLRPFTVIEADTPQSAANQIIDNLRLPIPVGEKVLELSGGAVPLDSPYYIERDTDVELKSCLARGEGVILIKGPRQIGKTSLTARALAWARGKGYKTALSDFQTVNLSELENNQGLSRAIAHRFAKDLGVPVDWQNQWNEWLGPNANLDDAVELVLSQTEGPVLWAMDEVDRLFGQAFTNDFFGLLRGWYNRRSLEPDGPWRRLTLLITYATEVHLFITDLNQSPFNIGVRLELDDFTPGQMAELNERYGSPLASDDDVLQLHDLTGGHPYLARRAFDWLVTTKGSVVNLEDVGTEDDGPFGDHLRRLLLMVSRDSATLEEVSRILKGEDLQEERTVYELAAGGLLQRGVTSRSLFRSALYRRWLESRLTG